MDERTVKVRGFSYHIERDNPYQPGTKILEPAQAIRGDKLDFDSLRPYDQERADKFDVFYTEAELKALEGGDASAPPAEAGGEGSPGDMDDAALAAWIEADEPTINDLLELAGDDPEMAQRILAAENTATGNEPRKGLVTGLQRIIGES